MTDDDIRSLIRAAIGKHLATSVNVEPGLTAGASAKMVSRADAAPRQPPPLSISFGRYALPRGEGETMCVIEPAVTCNHCGYCQCHGH